MSRTRLAASDREVSPAPTRPVSSRRWRRGGDEIAKLLFVAPAALALIVLFGYPVLKNLTTSFQDYTIQTFFTGEAPWVGLTNYITVTSGQLFTKTFINTAVFVVGSLIGQFVIGMLLALFFNRRFRLNGVLRALFLLPWLVPLIVGSAAWRALLDQDSGILNVALGVFGLGPVPWLTSPDVALFAVILVNTWISIPFNLTLLYSGLQDIPEELYEAGALDGATGWRAFWGITFPNLRPVVSIVLMLGIVYSLTMLDVILGLTHGGPANATQTIALQSYQRSFVEYKFGEGAALSNILILISLVFAIAYLRLTRRRVDE